MISGEWMWIHTTIARHTLSAIQQWPPHTQSNSMAPPARLWRPVHWPTASERNQCFFHVTSRTERAETTQRDEQKKKHTQRFFFFLCASSLALDSVFSPCSWQSLLRLAFFHWLRITHSLDCAEIPTNFSHRHYGFMRIFLLKCVFGEKLKISTIRSTGWFSFRSLTCLLATN